MFNLTITILATDCKDIVYAGESICIVLNVGVIATSVPQSTSRMAPQLQVLWQALPVYEHNEVQWDADTWSLFVAGNADPGSTLVMTSWSVAVDGRTVSFSENEFGDASGSLPAGCYGVANDGVSGSLAMGLACTPKVNGNPQKSASAVCIVPHMHIAQFTPATTVQVFLQSAASSGMVLSNSIDSIDRIDLNGGALTLQYDSAIAKFIRSSPAS